MPEIKDLCRLPIPGWHCTRTKGHEGPCAAVQDTPAPERSYYVPEEYEVLVIDGVRFSREVLEMMTRPDPEVWVRFRREDDMVFGERKA